MGVLESIQTIDAAGIQKLIVGYSGVKTSETIKSVWDKVLNINSVKFEVPFGGTLFNDNLRGLPSTINLPYQSIVVATSALNERGIQRTRLVLAEDKETDIRVTSILTDVDGRFTIGHLVTTIPKNFNLAMLKNLSNQNIFPELVATFDDHYRANLAQSCSVIFLLELIEALSCSNVYTETITPSARENRRRASNGKLPLFEYKILTIDVPTEHTANRVHLGGSHRSPRQHLRRGHVRVYNRGSSDELRIWINSMVINRKSPNVIRNEYNIRLG